MYEILFLCSSSITYFNTREGLVLIFLKIIFGLLTHVFPQMNFIMASGSPAEKDLFLSRIIKNYTYVLFNKSYDSKIFFVVL